MLVPGAVPAFDKVSPKPGRSKPQRQATLDRERTVEDTQIDRQWPK